MCKASKDKLSRLSVLSQIFNLYILESTFFEFMNLGHERQILKPYIYFFSLQRASSSKKVKLGRIPSARGAVRLSEAYVHLKILFA